MKRRLVISESERQTILMKHQEYKNFIIQEQATQSGATPTQSGTTTQERFKTATCTGLGKGPKCKDKALQVQIKINDKCPKDKLPTKLVEDGIWGPKSTAAFTACGGSISGGTTAQTSTPQTSGTQAPIGAQDSTASNTTANGGSSESIDSLSV